MHIILLRILFFTIAIAAIAVCADAKPDTAQRHIRNEAEADSITRIDRNQRCPLLKALCDDTALRSPDSELRALIGRSFADHYYVGLSAGKSWRPLERFGDRDNKLHVYNPTLAWQSVQFLKLLSVTNNVLDRNALYMPTANGLRAAFKSE